MQNTENYELDPNFAIACSFIEKFGALVGDAFSDLSIDGFKAFLEETEVDTDNLYVKFHINLIKGAIRYCKPNEFERRLIQFCNDFPDGDDKLIQSKGYGNIPIEAKLRILKKLCEDQFQYNDRFNRRVNALLDEEGISGVRHEPVGRDKFGRSYWFMLDKTSKLRLFRGWRNELTRVETWNVVCEEIDELKELIELLEENEELTNEDITLPEQPEWKPSMSLPYKTSPTKQPSSNSGDASSPSKSGLFLSSISSPRFIKGPEKRSMKQIRRDERKHNLPHCKVKLSRLKKSDYDITRTPKVSQTKLSPQKENVSETKQTLENDSKPDVGLFNQKMDTSICVKTEPEIQEPKVAFLTDLSSYLPNKDDVAVKKETKQIGTCSERSSLKNENEAFKLADTNPKTKYPGLVLKSEPMKCTIKTESELSAKNKCCEKSTVKDESNSINFGNSKCETSSVDGSGSDSESRVKKIDKSSVNKISESKSGSSSTNGSAEVNEKENGVDKEKNDSEKETMDSKKVKITSEKVSEETTVVVIDEKGDAGSIVNKITNSVDPKVQNGKLSADVKSVDNAAENSQDQKQSVTINDKKTDNESDIFNAAINNLLTLGSNAVVSSVSTVNSQTDSTGVKTATEATEDVDTSENVKKVKSKEVKDLNPPENRAKSKGIDGSACVDRNGINDEESEVKLDNEEPKVSQNDKESERKVHSEKGSESKAHSEKELERSAVSEKESESQAHSDKKSDSKADLDKELESSVVSEKESENKAHSDQVSENNVHSDKELESSTDSDKESESKACFKKESESQTNCNKESETKANSKTDQGSQTPNETKPAEVSKSKKVKTKNEVPISKEVQEELNTFMKNKQISIVIEDDSPKTPHKSWSNVESTGQVLNSSLKSALALKVKPTSKATSPSKNKNDDPETFLSMVMGIITDTGSGKKENEVSKQSSEKRDSLETYLGKKDKKSAEKDEMNMMVGDEMITIEVASSDSDIETDTKSVKETIKKEKDSETVTKPVKVKETKSAEKGVVNNSKSTPRILKSKPALTSLLKQPVAAVPTIMVNNASQFQGPNVIKLTPQLLAPASSSVSPIRHLLIQSPPSISVSSASPRQTIILQPSVNPTGIKPGGILKSNTSIMSLLKKHSPQTFAVSSATSPIIVRPVTSQVNVVHVNLPHGQAGPGTNVAPQVIQIPRGPTPKIVVANNLPRAQTMNPSSIRLAMPVQPLLTSSNVQTLMARSAAPVITNLVYVPPSTTMAATTLSSAGTQPGADKTNIKTALKQYLTSPVQKTFVADDTRPPPIDFHRIPIVPKSVVVAVKNGVHYDMHTNQPMTQVIAGPGGKYYDKESGYEMDVPARNNFTHMPGKLYLASGATFANGVKPTQKQKRPPRKKKTAYFKKLDASDTSDEEFEKILQSAIKYSDDDDNDDGDTQNSDDEDGYDYEQISKRVKTAKNIKLPARRASVESNDLDPELECESEDEMVPLVLGRNAKRAAALKSNYDDDNDDNDDDEECEDSTTNCKVCSSSKKPTTILLCDECDAEYHMACLSPPLSLVPLEDWFCPDCEHNKLVEALKTKLELAKKVYRKAYRASQSAKFANSRSGSGICPKAFSINSSNIVDLERRSCRNRKEVSYNEAKFDKMVVDAVKEMNSVKHNKKRKGISDSSSSSENDSDEESETPEKPVQKSKTRSSRRSDPKPKSTREKKTSQSSSRKNICEQETEESDCSSTTSSKKSKKKRNVKKSSAKKTRQSSARKTRTEEKMEESDCSSTTSSKKSNKKRKYTISDSNHESDSDYDVESDSSFDGDTSVMEPTPEKTPVKKTYMTLSGRATKNVSYKLT